MTSVSVSSPVLQPAVGGDAKIRFDEAVKELAAVFPIRISQFAQVVQHSYNWRGSNDASLMCDVGFTPSAIVIRGEFHDDIPFFQTLPHPSMPNWWKIRYGADGIEFKMDDPTSSARSLNFVLNFGSRAIRPRIELLATPQGIRTGFLESADFDISEPIQPEGKAPTPPGSGIQFHAAIPITSVADNRFFAGPLRITARLHDMDGSPETYLMMQEVIEKK